MEPLFPLEGAEPSHPPGPASTVDRQAPDTAAAVGAADHGRAPADGDWSHDPPSGAAVPSQRVFLTATEVGQQLGIRKSRVYELAAAGLLPVVRLGRRMRFPRRGLEELAAAAIERAKAEVLGRDGLDEYAAASTGDGSPQVGRGNSTRGRRVA